MTSAGREWLIVGRVRKPHGVHGEVLVEIITDFPERMEEGVRFGLGPEDGPSSFHEAHRVRYHTGSWIVAVQGIRRREPVEEWRGQYIFLPEQTLDELPEGYFYEHHLVGLEVRLPDGTILGEVAGLDEGPGQTRLVVRKGQRDFLVPWVPEIVRRVDLEAGSIELDPPAGLLDDDAL